MTRSSSILGSPEGRWTATRRCSPLSAGGLGCGFRAADRRAARAPGALDGPGVRPGAFLDPPKMRAGRRQPHRRALGTLSERVALRRATSADSDVFAMHLAFAPRAAASRRAFRESPIFASR
jgi:hypothetical protein